MIVNSLGEDVTQLFYGAADAALIPRVLAVGCSIGESELTPTAERWGRETPAAKAALAAKDWTTLQGIIDRWWADISFGYGQQIVAYHYLGDKGQSWQNCILVRAKVFADPVTNVYDMARRLRGCLNTALTQDLTMVGGDPNLGACTVYNVGHWPKNAAEWAKAAPHIQRYKESLARAQVMIDGTPVEPEPPVEEHPMDIATRADEMTWRRKDANGNDLPEPILIDRLGNGGAPYSPICEWQSDQGPMRFQQFWLGNLLEYPAPTEADPDARDVATAPEGTLNDAQLAQFRGPPA